MREGHVELRGVVKRFGTVEAVRDVSLAAPEGQITTLLGPSGCGKTTLLRLIAGFIRPDAGEVRIQDRCVNDLPPQRRTTAIVFQDYALFPHLSVFENVAYGLRRRRVRGAEIRRRVEEMLEFVGLAGIGRIPPLQLSGGQQQRVALARALVVEPDVLLLDEPLSNLDAKLRARVRTEVREIQRALGKTTILVTHDQEEALSISDRVAVMQAGRVHQVGTPREVYFRPADAFVADFVGIANLVPATVREVLADELQLESPLGALRVPRNGAGVTGGPVTLVLRPTAFTLSAAAAAGAVPVTVRATSFLGGVQRHQVELGALRLVVDQPLGKTEDVQARLWLAVDPTAVYLLPAAP
jgi:ABC-type Fe3+/spermidine/putrescine transport system ATPase subunit